MTADPQEGVPVVSGKFVQVGSERYLVKGVSYGTFAPNSDGDQLPNLARISSDFELMLQCGINTVRTYTVPRREVLDVAAKVGLRLIVGIPWTQHVSFLDDRSLARSIRRFIVDEVRSLAKHPAVLLAVVGNEIPPGVVRWHGADRVGRFLREVYHDAKDATPEMLLTYVNYPPTEYLDLSCFDLCAFNVYLHREQDLRTYLAHLHVVAGNRPLLLTEIGADSISEGEEGQGELVAMQLRAAFNEGVAGVVTYAWTDEWWRGGQIVEDWRFGLTDSARRPKPSLFHVSREYTGARADVRDSKKWPFASVLVCARNAADTITECLQSLDALDYPNYEVIVVNDGSKDVTGSLARCHAGVTVVDTGHVGLSAARNIALEQASGDIVAYVDADVRVDADWLRYVVQPFLQSDVAGSGGPNVVPADDHWIAQCVARAPGAPTHVLIDDRTAEHVPGCNMAFRRSILLAVGGFDDAYHAAGDDVDLCWRLQTHGYHIAFAPSALVWHRHRNSVRGYWRQQVGYGEAESWLMDGHPERYLDGQALWKGRIYSALPFTRAISRLRVNAGVWGTANFPAVYSTQVPSLSSLPHLMPWQMVSLLSAFIGAGCFLAGFRTWAGIFVLLAASGVVITIGRCLVYGWRTDVRSLDLLVRLRFFSDAIYKSMIAWLHVVQPVARAWGRFRGRLWSPVFGGKSAPSHTRSVFPSKLTWGQPVPLFTRGLDVTDFWSEHWIDRATLLRDITDRLKAHGALRVVDAHDPWQQDRDIAISTGYWGWLDLRTLLEEHDGGRCLFRVAARHRLATRGTVVVVTVGVSLVIALGLGLPFAALAALGSGTTLAVTMWRRIVRVHAGVQAVVSQVALEYGLKPLSINTGNSRLLHTVPEVHGKTNSDAKRKSHEESEKTAR